MEGRREAVISHIQKKLSVPERLCQMIPVIGNFFDGYCCPDFQVEQEADADE